MGQLIDGTWRTADELDNTPEREREPTAFRASLGTEAHPIEPDRYHLYVSRACPWAHGVVLVRALLDCEDTLSMDIVDPHRRTDGWEFTPEKSGCTSESQIGADYLRELYTAAEPNYTGKVTVPVLWDTENETIVNNESVEIMRQLASSLAETAGIDLYPSALRTEIDTTIEDLYGAINTAVYRAGFADTQSAYETAIAGLFEALDRYDQRLAEQRFLVGQQLTLADLRLFVTLVRFEAVYYTHFKCNRHRLVEYDHLWGFTRDLYQLPRVAGTVDMDHIKEHYFRSHPDINPSGIVPVGPVQSFGTSHDRESLDGIAAIR